MPVFEGFAIPNSIRRIDVAGRDVTEQLQLLLRKNGHVLHTSAEKEVVRMIKEKVCYVSLDPKREEKDWLKLDITSSDVQANCEDLKVLGKGDFKTLLKCRTTLREEVCNNRLRRTRFT